MPPDILTRKALSGIVHSVATTGLGDLRGFLGELAKAGHLKAPSARRRRGRARGKVRRSGRDEVR